MTTNVQQVSLYHTDFYDWIEETAQALRDRRWDDIDIDNLVEEVEALGRSEKRELRSRLEVLLMHLLKWQCQSAHRSRSWQATIREQRRQLIRLLEDSPSLRSYLTGQLPQCYEIAREQAAEETTIFLENFAVDCPFTNQQILDPEFFPDP